MDGRERPGSPSAFTSSISEALAAIFRLGTVTAHNDGPRDPAVHLLCRRPQQAGDGTTGRSFFHRLLYLVRKQHEVCASSGQIPCVTCLVLTAGCTGRGVSSGGVSLITYRLGGGQRSSLKSTLVVC